ncbi:hypothetical protein BV98_002303 [Sphingobium herbicidovorans NBRC 16415]|uniref:Protein NO VEIN C-terminal domain-containing protein n=2 Tax=Sphingobium herbicidovorans TaxID=76947 RepID=A0A086P921_SPHHM|nr:hypothetical protein BV98_002303 [Sphingobium herbicidovorans NBRC 16415]
MPSSMVAGGMAGSDSRGSDWSDQEIDLIVADYFAMLQMELAGQTFVKSHRNMALQQLISRSHASIEFKHGNISAVLERLGLPTIKGYRPRENFQGALIEGVGRYLGTPGRPEALVAFSEAVAVETPVMLPIVDAPPLSHVEKPSTRPLERLVRKFDPAVRDARNRSLGLRGEERAFHAERERLSAVGREDLARKVRWVSQEDGDGAGYDIRSYAHDGQERLLEVKTTLGHARTPFYLSSNELAFSQERPEAFKLLRVYDFARSAKAFELEPPLTDHVALLPTAYRASF